MTKRIGRDASLHEKTVQDIVTVKTNRHKRTKKVPDPVVTVTQVHPGIWASALMLAGGDASRITVLSPTKVEVR